MTYKVIQWATGGVGRAAIEAVIDHPELEMASGDSAEPASGRGIPRTLLFLLALLVPLGPFVKWWWFASSASLAACTMCAGVWKSGSPRPSAMMSSIVR